MDSRNNVNLKFLSHMNKKAGPEIYYSTLILTCLKDKVIDKHCIKLAD